jgi:hypothetical protein
MTRLAWDSAGERQFEAGVDRGVLYPTSGPGVPWNGLTRFTEQPTGGTVKPRYYDGMKIANPASAEEFGGTLEAYMYPDEFEPSDGIASDGNGLSFTMQGRKPFSLSYRTGLGDDLQGLAYGYKIHLLYNVMAAPTTRTNTSLSNQPAPGTMSWALTATPVALSGRRPTPHLIIDSTRTRTRLLSYVEDILYGTAAVQARLPLPSEMANLFSELKFYKIIPNTSTGKSQLVEADDADIMGFNDQGLYKSVPNSRLTQTAQPGLYTLEQ